jgi:hypothetical protein
VEVEYGITGDSLGMKVFNESWDGDRDNWKDVWNSYGAIWSSDDASGTRTFIIDGDTVTVYAETWNIPESGYDYGFSAKVYPIYTTEQECNRCSDSEYIDGRCYKKCNEGTFRNNDKKCVSCDVNGGWIEEYYYEFGPTGIISGKLTDSRFSLVKQNLGTSLQECNKCSNREYVNGFCVKKCAEDEFRDNEGYCVKCESAYIEQPESTLKEEELRFFGKIHSGEKVRIVKGTSGGGEFLILNRFDMIPESSLEECNKCSNRKYEDGKCSVKNAIK